MAVTYLTLYLPGSSQGIQVVEGSQLHLIYVAMGANSIPSAPGETVRADPFPQYVDGDELADALAGIQPGTGYTDTQAVTAVENATTVSPAGAWDFAQAPTVGGAPIGGGGSAPDATPTTKGIVQLAGDLGGTAAAPTVPGLSGKAPIASPTFTGTVGGVTKAMVGLGSVDNTADSAKPVSTAQQTALDAKPARTLTKRTVTAAYALVAADATDMVLHSTAAAAVTITLPQDSAATIAQEVTIPWRQYGAGQVTFAAGTGATLISRGSVFKSAGQYAEGVVTKVAANTWLLSGDIVA